MIHDSNNKAIIILKSQHNVNQHYEGSMRLCLMNMRTHLTY